MGKHDHSIRRNVNWINTTVCRRGLHGEVFHRWLITTHRLRACVWALALRLSQRCPEHEALSTKPCACCGCVVGSAAAPRDLPASQFSQTRRWPLHSVSPICGADSYEIWCQFIGFPGFQWSLLILAVNWGKEIGTSFGVDFRNYLSVIICVAVNNVLYCCHNCPFLHTRALSLPPSILHTLLFV